MKLCYSFFSWIILSSVTAFGFGDVNFAHSSGLDLMRQYSARYQEADADKKIKLLESNYNRLKPSKVPSNPTTIIPKVIHQIWVGTKPIPQNYQYYQQTWREFHPGWEIKLWTDKEILQEKFPSMDLYLAARSYVERADIARYEILHRYGGLYVDMDTECFANFDDINNRYEFYTNMEPPAINKKRVSILNAMIASVPGHPILNLTLKEIRQNWTKVETTFDKVSSRSRSSFARSNHHLAVQRTMYPLSDAVFSFLEEKKDLDHKAMILPAGYNIPVYFVNDIPAINFLSKFFRDKAKLSNKIIMQPETMSIHYHDKENSLMSEDYFANSLFKHSEIKGITYMLLNLRNKYYLAFRKLFQTKFPTLVEYQTFPMIPKVIYLNNSVNLSTKELSSLVSKWQELNPKFKVQVLSAKDLNRSSPKKIKYLSPEVKGLISRFYWLKKNGGVYVEPGFEPAELEEFNHKYGYYAQFDRLNSIKQKLSLNTNIIAMAPDHSIARNLLIHLESLTSQKKDIDMNVVYKLYLDYTYKYYQLDGDSIILPEMYFNQKR